MKPGKRLHSIQGAVLKEVVREVLSEEAPLSGAPVECESEPGGIWGRAAK